MTVTLIEGLIYLFVFAIISSFLVYLFNRNYVRKNYRANLKNLLKKEICEKCNCKMKKEIKKRILYSNESSKNLYKTKTYEIAPEFTCYKCGYKIDAKFYYMKHN